MSDANRYGYQIFTDATADVCDSMLRVLPDIEIIPMEVAIGEENYVYGRKGRLTASGFYAMQRTGRFASTAQINPVAYANAFEPALQSGLDVLYLGFSSGMSGSLNNARLCMEELRARYPERKLICIDTLCASVGEGFLVCEAARKQREGMDIDTLAAWAQQNRLKICHWFTVDTFEHLKHGGRVSAASAAVGSMLNIKPLLHVDEQGKLAVMKKPRGRRKAIAEQIALMEQGWMKEVSSRVVIGHGDDQEAAGMLADAVCAHFPEAEVHVTQIGPVIGTHTGPGMLALIYWGNNR